MELSIKPLSFGLGAQVIGIDLGKSIDDVAFKKLMQAWHQHLVLVFRDQEITPEQQIKFTERLGELDRHEHYARSQRHPDYPEMFKVTTRPNADGSPSSTIDTGIRWHSDHASTVRPAGGSLLYCLECPPLGGDTMFTNMYMAYETLSPTFQKILASLWAVHDNSPNNPNNWNLRKKTDRKVLEEFAGNNPAVEHPAVRVHPNTGRKALFVHAGQTTHFVGMSIEESRGIIDYLEKHSVRAEFTYRHQWRPKDAVLWDNRCTMHLALRDYDQSFPRTMHRTTVHGEVIGRLVSDRSAQKVAA